MFLDMSFGHYKGLDLLGEEKGVPDMALTFFSMSSQVDGRGWWYHLIRGMSYQSEDQKFYFDTSNANIKELCGYMSLELCREVQDGVINLGIAGRQMVFEAREMNKIAWGKNVQKEEKKSQELKSKEFQH